MSKYFNKYYWIRKLFVNSFVSKFVNQRLLNKIVFNSIYKSNHWNKSQKLDLNQSYSGPGSASNSIQTNNLIIEFKKFFKENGQILDWTKNKIYYKTTIIKWRGSSVG